MRINTPQKIDGLNSVTSSSLSSPCMISSQPNSPPPPLGSWPTYSAFRGIAPNEKIMKGGRPPSPPGGGAKNEEEEHPGTGGDR